MKILAYIALIWLVCLTLGAGFGVLGEIIWFAILLTGVIALYQFLKQEFDIETDLKILKEKIKKMFAKQTPRD